MESKDKKPQSFPGDDKQVNHIDKVQEPPTDKGTNPKQYAQQHKEDVLRDMHIESGEKINDYLI